MPTSAPAFTPSPAPAEARQPVETIITRERERELLRETALLRHELDVEFAGRLREAREYGEIGNNDDYLQIQEEEAVVASRLRRLRAVLQSARVREDLSAPAGAITVGSTVEVTDLATGSRRSHRITGGYEPLRAGEVSVNSPVGQALLDRVENDEVTITLPNGAVVHVKINKVAAA